MRHPSALRPSRVFRSRLGAGGLWSQTQKVFKAACVVHISHSGEHPSHHCRISHGRRCCRHLRTRASGFLAHRPGTPAAACPSLCFSDPDRGCHARARHLRIARPHSMLESSLSRVRPCCRDCAQMVHHAWSDGQLAIRMGRKRCCGARMRLPSPVAAVSVPNCTPSPTAQATCARDRPALCNLVCSRCGARRAGCQGRAPTNYMLRQRLFPCVDAGVKLGDFR